MTAARWHISRPLANPQPSLNLAARHPFVTVDFDDGSWIAIQDAQQARELARAFTDAAHLLEKRAWENGGTS